MRNEHGSAALQGCCVVVTGDRHDLSQQSRHSVSSPNTAKSSGKVYLLGSGRVESLLRRRVLGQKLSVAPNTVFVVVVCEYPGQAASIMGREMLQSGHDFCN